MFFWVHFCLDYPLAWVSIVSRQLDHFSKETIIWWNEIFLDMLLCSCKVIFFLVYKCHAWFYHNLGTMFSEVIGKYVMQVEKNEKWHIVEVYYPFVSIKLIIPPASTKLKGGILVSPCPSVCPSVCLWTESCPLCIFNNTHRIHFIWHILSSNFRRCVACKVCIKVKKFIIWQIL